jgi:hypothetical protein
MKFRIVFWDVLPGKIFVDRRFRGTCKMCISLVTTHIPVPYKCTPIYGRGRESPPAPPQVCCGTALSGFTYPVPDKINTRYIYDPILIFSLLFELFFFTFLLLKVLCMYFAESWALFFPIHESRSFQKNYYMDRTNITKHMLTLVVVSVSVLNCC